MPDYEAMYFKLLGVQATAIELMQEAARETERQFLWPEDPPAVLLPSQKDAGE
ncbi:MAG: hypothetical protein GXY32_06250 [Ruminococcaceae bacterium]|nr:hypothetical protein [Oscillospiraceae bacterium]